MKFSCSYENSRYVQYAAGFATSVVLTSFTSCFTWLSPALDLFKSGDTPVGIITTEETSWIASSLTLGTLPGFLCAGFLARKFGRRRTILCACLPISIPWFIIAFSTSVLSVCVTQFVMGVMGAICVTTCTIYISEISDKDIRGRMTSMMTVVSSLGTLFMLGVGPFLSYTILCLSCSCLPIVAFILFHFVPESPYYYANTDQKEKLIRSVKRLSPKSISDQDLQSKIDAVCKYVQESNEEKITVRQLLFKKQYRTPLIVMFVIKTLQMFSGGTGITAHLQIIVKESQGSISPKTTSVITSFTKVFSVIISALAVDKIGRKPLIIIASFGSFITLSVEGTYFYLKDFHNVDLSAFSWAPAVALIVYRISRSLGLSAAPTIVLGELFSSNIKETAVSIFTFYGGLLNFLVLKYFLPISEKWGMQLLFFFFATICLIGTIFVCCLLPETKNKTLADVQNKIKGKSKKIHQDTIELSPVA